MSATAVWKPGAPGRAPLAVPHVLLVTLCVPKFGVLGMQMHDHVTCPTPRHVSCVNICNISMHMSAASNAAPA
jgi:hypothetical protein